MRVFVHAHPDQWRWLSNVNCNNFFIFLYYNTNSIDRMKFACELNGYQQGHLSKLLRKKNTTETESIFSVEESFFDYVYNVQI